MYAHLTDPRFFPEEPDRFFLALYRALWLVHGSMMSGEWPQEYLDGLRGFRRVYLAIPTPQEYITYHRHHREIAP